MFVLVGRIPWGIRGFGDSDRAGDRKTRKSTSGGVVMIGSHLLHHDSNSQANTALRSAEAELTSNVKLIVECSFVKHMSSDVGVNVGVNTLNDSSAAKGIQTRGGCGKVKHLDAKQVWVQERVARGI